MKKLLGALLLLAGAVMYNSCSKDKTPIPPEAINCPTTDSLNTWDLRIKFVLDDNCISGCHDAITANSQVILDSYTAAKNSIETRDVLCAMKHGNGCLPMPSASNKLADSLITFIECWKSSGYPR